MFKRFGNFIRRNEEKAVLSAVREAIYAVQKRGIIDQNDATHYIDSLPLHDISRLKTVHRQYASPEHATKAGMYRMLNLLLCDVWTYINCGNDEIVHHIIEHERVFALDVLARLGKIYNAINYYDFRSLRTEDNLYLVPLW